MGTLPDNNSFGGAAGAIEVSDDTRLTLTDVGDWAVIAAINLEARQKRQGRELLYDKNGNPRREHLLTGVLVETSADTPSPGTEVVLRLTNPSQARALGRAIQDSVEAAGLPPQDKNELGCPDLVRVELTRLEEWQREDGTIAEHPIRHYAFRVRRLAGTSVEHVMATTTDTEAEMCLAADDARRSRLARVQEAQTRRDTEASSRAQDTSAADADKWIAQFEGRTVTWAEVERESWRPGVPATCTATAIKAALSRRDPASDGGTWTLGQPGLTAEAWVEAHVVGGEGLPVEQITRRFNQGPAHLRPANPDIVEVSGAVERVHGPQVDGVLPCSLRSLPEVQALVG